MLRGIVITTIKHGGDGNDGRGALSVRGGGVGRGGRVEAIEATGQAEVEWRLKKRSATSPRGIARGRPIANGTDGTNARVASLFPPANRVKSPCPPRSSIRGEPRQPAPLTLRPICARRHRCCCRPPSLLSLFPLLHLFFFILFYIFHSEFRN